MTVRRWLVVLAVVVALLALWNWSRSDARRIAGRLDRMQELVEKSGAESQLVGLSRARQVTELFATPFEVRAEQLRFSTRDRQQLTGFIHGYRRGAERIRMRIFETTLSISPEVGRATQMASFQFTGGGPLGSPSETYRVQINWLEQHGDWRIDYIDLVEILGP